MYCSHQPTLMQRKKVISMANMGYCRFYNTRSDMEDCLTLLRDETRLSKDEAHDGRWMFEDILSYCQDNGIISSYNGGLLEAIFEGLVQEDDDE